MEPSPDLAPTSPQIQSAPPSPPPGENGLAWLDQFPVAPVRWLWPGRIPAGAITPLSGDPGTGKSLMAADIMARLTAGRMWPDGAAHPPAPQHVVYFGGEDDLARVVRPRVEAAGGDPTRVATLGHLTVRRPGGRVRPFDLARDQEVLRAHLAACDPPPALVIVDPLYCNLSRGGSVDEVRTMAAALHRIIERFAAAFFLITHLNKESGRSAMYRTSGSLALTAASRCAHLLAIDPLDATRRLLLPIKNNFAPLPPGLAFVVRDGRVFWDAQPLDVAGEQALWAPSVSAPPQGLPSGDEVQAFLADLLVAGPVAAAEVWQRAQREGFAKKAVRRAAERLRVISRKPSVRGGWVWMLPWARSSSAPADESSDQAGAVLSP